VVIFLPLEVTIEAVVCEESFFGGASPLVRLFEKFFLGKCLERGKL